MIRQERSVRLGWMVLAAFALLAILVAALARQAGPASVTSPSPSAPPSVTPAATPTASAPPTTLPTVAASTSSPAATPTSAPRSPEELADRLAQALEASDWGRIERLIAPKGWNAGWWRSEGTPDMTPQQAIDWLKQRTRDGRLAVTVQRRPIRSSSDLPENPPRPYVTSEWRDFDNGRDGRLPTQQVVLLFNTDAAGNWYWQTAIFNYTV